MPAEHGLLPKIRVPLILLGERGLRMLVAIAGIVADGFCETLEDFGVGGFRLSIRC